ncbi:hypothetical protein KCV07_g4023, partial [Aureobasidium melanogenum]
MAPPTKTLNLMKHTMVTSSIKSPKPVTTFLDLPQEILHMITTLLDEEQLPVLRLVSKQACYRLSDLFAKVHFAHLRHHLTETSLYDLIQITKHDMFSTCVKSIEFSTARTKYPSQGSPNPLLGEDSEFRRAGHHITMLVTVLENLSHRGNHKVSLGVFDSFWYSRGGILRPIDTASDYSGTLGHGYTKSYGLKNVLTHANPHGTMFSISEATKISGYSLQRLSMTTTLRSRTQDNLIRDSFNVLLIKGSNQFKSNLTFKYVVIGTFTTYRLSMQNPCLTIEVQTGLSSHLSLQGQNCASDLRNSRRVTNVGAFLRDLPLAFTDTNYQKVTLRDLQIRRECVTWLSSRTTQQPFEDLELFNMVVGVNNDADVHEPLAVTFLKHFKTSYSIKVLRISNFVVVPDIVAARQNGSETQPLRLAAEEIVAKGYNQVQGILDNLIAQIFSWYGSIGGN